jgi:thiamine biosynthesis lipoprotein ApbE
MQDSEVFLVSNWAYVFRIECGARVRQIERINHKKAQAVIAADEDYASLMDAIADIKDKSTGRSIHVGFFPGRFGLDVRDFPLKAAEQKTLLDSGWTIIRNDELGLLIQNIKNPS